MNFGTSRSQRSWIFQGGLLGPILDVLKAVAVTAGPWLVAVLALSLAEVGLSPLMERGAIEDLRLTIIYAFVVAPLVAGPIGTLAARLIRLDSDTNESRLAGAIALVAALGSAIAAELVALLLVAVLGIGPVSLAAGFVFICGAAAILWVSFAVLSAMGLHRLLLAAFSLGMIAALALAILVTRTAGPSPGLMVWCFDAGLVLCAALIWSRLIAAAPRDNASLARAARLLLGSARREWRLLAGVFCGIAAVWADKWVYWVGPDRVVSDAGYLHFPLYDSVMFVAHLSIIPAFASLFLAERDAFGAPAARLYRTLDDGSDRKTVAGMVRSLGQSVWRVFFLIATVQAAVAVVMILMAPVVAQLMHFQFEQFATLRIGLVAIFLQALFFMACHILVFCRRITLFLACQIGFLILNAGLTEGFQRATGLSADGVFVASLIMTLVAFVAAQRSLVRFDYVIMVEENPGLYRPRGH